MEFFNIQGSDSAFIPKGSAGKAGALPYFSCRTDRFLTGGWGSSHRILCQRGKEQNQGKVINSINEGT